MLPDDKVGCHRAGMQMTCFDGVTKHRCRLWKLIQGQHPQTGEVISKWDCLDAMGDLFAIDTIRKVEGTQAATESMRNEIVSRMDRNIRRIEISHNGTPLPLEDQR